MPLILANSCQGTSYCLGDRLQRVARVDGVRRLEAVLGRVDHRARELAKQRFDLLRFGRRQIRIAVPLREHLMGGDELLALERALNLWPAAKRTTGVAAACGSGRSRCRYRRLSGIGLRRISLRLCQRCRLGSHRRVAIGFRSDRRDRHGRRRQCCDRRLPEFASIDHAGAWCDWRSGASPCRPDTAPSGYSPAARSAGLTGGVSRRRQFVYGRSC